jgi:ABC-type transporter Mla subunit MlaD
MAGARRRGEGGITPFAAGLIAIILLAIASFFAFTRLNPFASPFKITATFESANNLQRKSPVRIAGVEVGKVKKVEPIEGAGGAAVVEMEIQDRGLPIHEDAEMKIRQRIFLEGNFFVDVYPGTASAPVLKDGGEIPVNQTATPVQFGQILTALQSDTREDLQTLLEEYGEKGLGYGDLDVDPQNPPPRSLTGAFGFNQSLDHQARAFRYSAIANEATLGEQPGDLHRLMRGQQRTFRALSENPQALRNLVTDFNTTAAAFAREDQALEAAIPELRDVLVVGHPALGSLNDALPSLRAFARDALPGTRSSGPTIDASLPFVRQARRLVSPAELGGLARDLRFTIPALARLNRATIPLLNQQRALSRCQNNVLLPFSKTPIPDPDFSENSGQPFYKQAPRGLVGLSGESRLFDGNTPFFHIQFGSGATTIVQRDVEGESFFAQAFAPPEGNRPARPANKSVFRPNVACETQEPPNMNALLDSPDEAVNPAGQEIFGTLEDLLNALPLPRRRESRRQYAALDSHLKRERRGQPSLDPLEGDWRTYEERLDAVGLKLDRRGRIVEDEEAGK